MSCDTIDDGQILATAVRPFWPGYKTASTATELATPVPQLADPALTDGTSALGDNYAELLFFALLAEESEGGTAQARIVRWDTVTSPDGRKILWVPIPILTVDLTFADGAVTGVDDTMVESEYYFCGSITLATSSDYDSGYELPTDQPGAGLIASMRVDPKGSQYLSVSFDISEGLASANYLLKTY